MSAYRSDFDETQYIPFMIKNEEKQNGIWKKVSNTIKKDFIVNLLIMKKI